MKEIQSQSAGTKRILWVDICKALAITLVVVGHATGQFNQFIYQFHLAAFFFISGYVAKQEKQSFVSELMKRLYTLILPLVILVFINAGIMAWLHSAGHYELWFGEYQYIGFKNIILEFFKYGRLYTWYLGAAWFIGVLFFTTLFSKLLYMLSNQKNSIYMIYSLMIYTIGYQLVGKLGEVPYNLDLVLIAQFFYCLGFCIKKGWNEKIAEMKWQIAGGVMVVTTIIMCLLSVIPYIRISYVARSFDNIFVNTFSCFNGICWLYAFSQLIAKITYQKIIKVFNLVGQNTLGIVLLHFILFKVVYAFLYGIGIASQEEMGLITPKEDIGNVYWWLFSIISIAGCCVIWIGIKKIPVVSAIFGLDRNVYRFCENKIKTLPINQKWQQHKEAYKEKTEKAGRIAANALCCIICIIYAGYQCKYVSLYICPQDIYFPTQSKMVSFSEGWLDQSNETYRWIQDKGVMTMNTLCHSKIRVEGGVPENFENVSKLDIYVNDTLVGTIDTKKTPFFGQDFEIPKMKKTTQLEITFDFDGVQEPQEDSGDPRTLSGMISRVYVE